MVRDGIYYGVGLIAAAVLLAWLTMPVLALVPLLLAAFFLWFFRDPERQIPSEPGVIVSPGDGKVTDVSAIEFAGAPHTRVSIFLNVFNVHVNRAPVTGVLTKVEYRRGKFRNAMGAISAEENEQNIATVSCPDGQVVVFKQIAGLLARRIVFTKRLGDRVERGERVGLIKFGSRVDVIFPASAAVAVQVGDHVQGGSSALGQFPVAAREAEMPSRERVQSR
jgi:phosphatidylserine decarboxylase